MENKFRMFDKKKKIYEELLIGSMVCDEYMEGEHILEQSLGGKDKNGKEIFEGDIIRGEEKYWDIDTNNWESRGIVVGHIWYNKFSFCYIVSFNHFYSETSTELMNLHDLEVIGNINEDGEKLLKDNLRRY